MSLRLKKPRPRPHHRPRLNSSRPRTFFAHLSPRRVTWNLFLNRCDTLCPMLSCTLAESIEAKKSFTEVLVLFLFFGITICLSAPRSSISQQKTKPYLREVRIDILSAFILSFDIASNSDLAAAAVADRRIRVWKLSSGEVIHEFSFPSPETDENLKFPGATEPISVRFFARCEILGHKFS